MQDDEGAARFGENGGGISKGAEFAFGGFGSTGAQSVAVCITVICLYLRDESSFIYLFREKIFRTSLRHLPVGFGKWRDKVRA